MKNFWFSDKWNALKKFLIALLGLALVFSSAVLSFAEGDEPIAVLGQLSSGSSTVQRDFEILLASSAGGQATWVTPTSPDVIYAPLVDDTHYGYGWTNSGYVSGIRIYFTVIGQEFNNFTMSFTLKDSMAYHGEEYYEGFNAFFALRDKNGNYMVQNVDPGISSFNELNGTFDVSFMFSGDLLVNYTNQSSEYSYNGYVEFHFTEVNASQGWPNYDGSYTAFGKFDTYFRFFYNTDFSVLPFNAYFLENDILDQVKALLLNNPVMPVYDFVNGTIVTNFLGSSLPTVVNPFLAIFVGDSVNSTWRYLCIFSFGMFVLSTMIFYLRREGHKS